MISLYDATLTDLLRNDFSHDPEVRSFAYAILQEKRRLIDLAKGTRTLAVIDELPEKVLDLLSVELQAPAYDEQFPLATKRALIKGALSFHAKMGTPKAVDWLIETVFGNGKIEEWFDYGGQPHCFRVTVRRSSLTDLSNFERFTKLIGRVKRLSSHLDTVIVTAEPIETPLHIGVSGAIISRLAPTEQSDNLSARQTVRTGGRGAVVIRASPSEQPDNLSARQTVRTGGRGAVVIRASPSEQPDSLSAERTVRHGGRPAIVSVLRGREI